MSIQIDDILIDKRDNTENLVSDIVTNGKGTLYTVFNPVIGYRRYYQTKLNRLFSTTGRTNSVPSTPSISYDNVVFIDFKSRTKFANYDSWYTWMKKVV